MVSSASNGEFARCAMRSRVMARASFFAFQSGTHLPIMVPVLVCLLTNWPVLSTLTVMGRRVSPVAEEMVCPM